MARQIWTLVPSTSKATRTHAVHLLPGQTIPAAFSAPGSVQHVPATGSVAAAATALEPLGAHVEARAREMDLGDEVAHELRRAVVVCHVLAARGALRVGALLALILRMEMYGPKEPANGYDHDKHVLELPFKEMPRAHLYFQKYHGGRNWGVCLRGGGTTNFLVRAVFIPGRGELGMSNFAKFLANKLGVTLGTHVSAFHYIGAQCQSEY